MSVLENTYDTVSGIFSEVISYRTAIDTAKIARDDARAQLEFERLQTLPEVPKTASVSSQVARIPAWAWLAGAGVVIFLVAR